jgi:hypothetical protein
LVAGLTDRDLESVTAWIWRPQELQYCHRRSIPGWSDAGKRLVLSNQNKKERSHHNSEWHPSLAKQALRNGLCNRLEACFRVSTILSSWGSIHIK